MLTSTDIYLNFIQVLCLSNFNVEHLQVSNNFLHVLRNNCLGNFVKS